MGEDAGSRIDRIGLRLFQHKTYICRVCDIHCCDIKENASASPWMGMLETITQEGEMNPDIFFSLLFRFK